jgi:hypothetical protein
MISIGSMTDEDFERHAFAILQRELGLDGLARFRRLNRREATIIPVTGIVGLAAPRLTTSWPKWRAVETSGGSSRAQRHRCFKRSSACTTALSLAEIDVHLRPRRGRRCAAANMRDRALASCQCMIIYICNALRKGRFIRRRAMLKRVRPTSQ